MTRRIDTQSVINWIRMLVQGSDPAAPAATYDYLFTKTSGLFLENPSGSVAGPLGMSFEPGGRLTLTTATPVTIADVTAAATLYYTPYKHDMISLFDGARWIPVPYTEQSISLAAQTASKPYDDFGYLSSGTLALESLVWTNATTRATALAYQNGRLVKNGDASRLYLGTHYVNSSGGQTDDSVLKRNVWNYYNRRYRSLFKQDLNAHAYNNAATRAWNNDAAVRVEYCCGVLEDTMNIGISADVDPSSGITAIVSLALDLTNTHNTDRLWHRDYTTNEIWAGIVYPQKITNYLAIGWHWWQAVESSSATATNNFYEVTINGGIWG